MNGPKIYFTIPLFGGIPITQTTVSSFAVMLLLCIAGIVLGSNLQKRPSRRQVLVEKGVTMLYGMVEDTMGKHNSYWTPYIGALFLSSIFGSYIGMMNAVRSILSDEEIDEIVDSFDIRHSAPTAETGKAIILRFADLLNKKRINGASWMFQFKQETWPIYNQVIEMAESSK